MTYTFYLLLFIISFLELVALIKNYRQYVSAFYVLLFFTVMVSNLGYVQLSTAKTVGEALIANQVMYLGGCYIPPLIFICVADLCKIKTNKIVNTILFMVSSGIYGLISSIGYNQLYYKKVELVIENGYSYLVKEYGPLHILYPVFLVAMIAMAIGITIKSFRMRKQVSYITSIILVTVSSQMVVVYFFERMLHSKLEYIPLAFAVMEAGILLILQRVKLYNVSAIFVDSMKENHDYGHIIVDRKGRFAGADKVAREWFDEINDLKVDMKLKKDDSELLSQICQWAWSGSGDQEVIIERNNRSYRIMHRVVYGKNDHLKAHCISLRDDTAQQEYLELIQGYNDKLEKSVKEKTSRLEKIQEDIILSMASIVENRDSNTGGHIQRTSKIVEIFVKYLMEKGVYKELTPKLAECIRKAAPLHDFGKIGIPDVILNKPGRFEPYEYEEMKKHSEKGANIVAGILENSDDELFRQVAVNIAHYHHEKWDGNGYPCRLKELQIPFEARIMALADVFDALVSKRVYKEQFSYDKAFGIIEESCGTHFDPKLCRYFLEIRDSIEDFYNKENEKEKIA